MYGRSAPEPTTSTVRPAAGLSEAGVKSTPRAWTWAALMHRVFGIDVLACPQCVGRLRLVATLHDPAVIRKILGHLAPSPELQRTLTEALEQQTATSEILRVISESQTDVQPVFDTLAEAVLRLCGAVSSLVTTFDG